MEKLLLGLFIGLPVVYLLHQIVENIDTRRRQDDAVWEAQQLVNGPRTGYFDD